MLTKFALNLSVFIVFFFETLTTCAAPENGIMDAVSLYWFLTS
jgi:hypothetical protein